MVTMDFSKAQIIKKDQLKTRHERYDYKPLLKKVAALQEDEALIFPVTKVYEVKLIKRAVEEGFQHSEYHVGQRTVNGKLSCYIIRSN